MLIHCLLIQTALLMKPNQKMFMKNVLNANTCLILVNTNQFFLIQLTKKVFSKRKMNLKEFKSKMYCIVYYDDAEKIAKGVNMSIEFNEYKDVLFNEKVIRHKMERIQSKEHEIGTYDVNKI